MAGSVPIVLDKERNLRFDFNALADADEVAGKSVNEFLAGERVGLAAIRALLWAGLKHEDRRLTIEQTGALLQAEISKDDGSILPLINKIHDAFKLSGIFGGPGTKNGATETEKPSGSGNG